MKQILYDEQGLRLTRYGAWTSKASDQARVEVLRQLYEDSVRDLSDLQLIDAYELWLLSESHQNWINSGNDAFISWLDDYPIPVVQRCPR